MVPRFATLVRFVGSVCSLVRFVLLFSMVPWFGLVLSFVMIPWFGLIRWFGLVLWFR